MTIDPDDIRLEPILTALFEVVRGTGAVDTTPTVTRNLAELQRFDTSNAALLNMLDGGSVLQAEMLGGAAEYLHIARIEIVARGEEHERDMRFAELRADLHRRIRDSRNLGGRVDLIDVLPPEEPDPQILAFAEGVKAGVVPIQFLYTAPSVAG